MRVNFVYYLLTHNYNVDNATHVDNAYAYMLSPPFSRFQNVSFVRRNEEKIAFITCLYNNYIFLRQIIVAPDSISASVTISPSIYNYTQFMYSGLHIYRLYNSKVC